MQATLDRDNIRKTEARSQTSFLSLPDDLLYFIYEEVREQRCQDVETANPPRVVEILVNKRIFAVARPLWFSRLSIRKDQLDRRLSRLLGQPERRQSVRHLEIVFASTFALLTQSIIAQLPGLTRFSITCDEWGHELVDDTLVAIIGSISTLRHLVTSFDGEAIPTDTTMLMRMWHARPASLRSWSHAFDGVVAFTSFYRGTLIGTSYFDVEPEDCRGLSWETIESCECVPLVDNQRPLADDFLEGLAAALQQDADGKTPQIPLRRLKLGLGSIMGWENGLNGGPARFDTLFRLLSLTRLERLELSSVHSVPQPETPTECPSIKILKVSGKCTFKQRDSFRAFHRFLSMFPSLLQLHLVGDLFFDNRKLPSPRRADAISRLEETEQYFKYPELCALLFFLRKTQVRIFTYRGAQEKREMRWTRCDETDDFRADCWTL